VIAVPLAEEVDSQHQKFMQNVSAGIKDVLLIV